MSSNTKFSKIITSYDSTLFVHMIKFVNVKDEYSKNELFENGVLKTEKNPKYLKQIQSDILRSMDQDFNTNVVQPLIKHIESINLNPSKFSIVKSMSSRQIFNKCFTKYYIENGVQTTLKLTGFTEDYIKAGFPNGQDMTTIDIGMLLEQVNNYTQIYDRGLYNSLFMNYKGLDKASIYFHTEIVFLYDIDFNDEKNISINELLKSTRYWTAQLETILTAKPNNNEFLKFLTRSDDDFMERAQFRHSYIEIIEKQQEEKEEETPFDDIGEDLDGEPIHKAEIIDITKYIEQKKQKGFFMNNKSDYKN